MDVWHWVLASLPILTLLILLLRFRINTAVAGAIAMLVAGALSLFIFGGNPRLLSIATGKGISLAFFVLLIVWSSLLLYNLMRSLGLIRSIASSIAGLTGSHLGQALMCGWAFAGFIEGVAGFGVPVAVIAPLMMALGFSPLVAASTVLIGHSWAVTYGGMAAAYYTLQLSTGLPAELIGPTLAGLFYLPILATGFCVAHIQVGWKDLKRAAPVVLISGSGMAGAVWLCTILNVPQIAAIVAGLMGCAIIWVLTKSRLLKDISFINTEVQDKGVNFHLAFMPYYSLVFLALLTQVPAIKSMTQPLHIAFSFPGAQTALGYVVAPAQDYAKINLFGHPAPIIIMAFLITLLGFRWSRYWQENAVMESIKITARQCMQPSLSILTMVVMALIMNDSGMTNILATSVAQATGMVFPLFAPYIGVLGCFMTGSNTNSNVMFGKLQMDAAVTLGINPVITASAQTIGGSLGASIAPAKVLLGSSAVGLSGKEGTIIRKTLIYCLLVTILVGFEMIIAAHI